MKKKQGLNRDSMILHNLNWYSNFNKKFNINFNNITKNIFLKKMKIFELLFEYDCHLIFAFITNLYRKIGCCIIKAKNIV